MNVPIQEGGLDPEALDAVIFDYGSTLIEFAPAEVARCDAAIADVIIRRYGAHDPERFREIRVRDRARPFGGDPPTYRENTVEGLAHALVRELYDTDPDVETVRAITSARRDAFVEVVSKPPYLDAVLRAISSRFRLGLLSNYPDGEAIRRSAEHLEISGYFDAIEVSGEIGVVKPHPLAFSTVCTSMKVEPERALYVGDNWLADVQGAKRAGMRVVLTTQFVTPEAPTRRPGDAEPDAVIGHLAELVPLLNGHRATTE